MPARLPGSALAGFVGRAIVAFLPTLTEAVERGTPADSVEKIFFL
jgi:hypothetical protein